MTDILQPVSAVILVLGLLGSLLVALRRRGMASFSGFSGVAASTARQMKLVEKIPLGAQHSLHLVRVGDRLILVATGPGSCQMMDAAEKGNL